MRLFTRASAPVQVPGTVRNEPAFGQLSPQAQTDIAEIVRLAAKRPDGADFVDKIRQVLETPYVPTSVEAENRAELSSSVAAAAGSGADSQAEERLSADPSRAWTPLTPKGGRATVLREQGKPVPHIDVDRSDPNNIIARVRVHLNGPLSGDVSKLEDAIEKHVAHPGFTVDLQLVDKPGPDVYEVNTDPSKWTEADNWVGTSNALGHELMHLLGLDDEYDYRSHATNSAMTMDERLHWLKVEAGRAPAPGDAWQGIMTDANNPVLPRQVRAVAQLGDAPGDDEKRAEAKATLQRARLAFVVP